MTIFLTLGSVGCRVENEYTISVGSNLTNAVLTFCVYFFKEKNVEFDVFCTCSSER